MRWHSVQNNFAFRILFSSSFCPTFFFIFLSLLLLSVTLFPLIFAHHLFLSFLSQSSDPQNFSFRLWKGSRMVLSKDLKGIYPGIFQGIIPKLSWGDGGMSQRNTLRAVRTDYNRPPCRHCGRAVCIRRVIWRYPLNKLWWDHAMVFQVPWFGVGPKVQVILVVTPLSFNFNYDNFITNSVEMSPSWETKSCSAIPEMSCISWASTVFTRACHSPLSWIR
jgi:hypothetical protein